MRAGNVFSRLGNEETEIFKDERVLMPDYLPEVLPHREKEIEGIALALKPAARGKRTEGLFIHGPPGSGKTACVRYVLEHLKEYTQRAVPIYINCWETSTRHGILSTIATALGEILPRRGIATDEITERIVGAIRREGKLPVVALDEADRLFASQYEEERIVYDLVRACEVFSVNFGTIIITNKKEILIKLDERIRSSLAQRQVEFKRYGPDELKDILRERARMAFHPNTVDDESIALCAAYAAKNGGDARLAINCLWKAGRIAEAGTSGKVRIEDVRKAFLDVSAELEKRKNGMLDETSKRIIEVLRERGEIKSGELYSLIKENDRTIRNHLKKLERLGMIETVLVKEGRGKTRIIRIKRTLFSQV
ncbi:MAG: AAA family ATPase [Candidatus Micrarchaeia archaeon]